MKKLAVLLGAALLSAASTASAEHKLLITDVLDPGKADFTVAFDYFRMNEPRSVNLSELNFTVGGGIAKNLEVSVNLPYVANLKVDSFDSANGWGDITVAAKYRILNESPITFTTGLAVTFDTGSRQVTNGDTQYSPLFAVSKNVGQGLKPYGAYLPIFRGDDQTDTHTIRLGLEAALSKTATIDVRLDNTYYAGTGADDTRASSIDVAAYLEMGSNFYFIPRAGFAYISNEFDEATALNLGASLYYMF